MFRVTSVMWNSQWLSQIVNALENKKRNLQTKANVKQRKCKNLQATNKNVHTCTHTIIYYTYTTNNPTSTEQTIKSTPKQLERKFILLQPFSICFGFYASICLFYRTWFHCQSKVTTYAQDILTLEYEYVIQQSHIRKYRCTHLFCWALSPFEMCVCMCRWPMAAVIKPLWSLGWAPF